MTDPLTITAAAYGPYGVGRRADGKVVLVRRAVPGDVVAYTPTLEKKSRVEADIAEVLEPSPDRRTPPCPAFGQCGGCTWMAMSRAAQLRHKQEVVCHALRHVDPPEVPLPQHDEMEFHYRQRARLHVKSVPGEGVRIGFFSHGTHDIVPISGCPICLEPLSRVVGRLAGWQPPEPFDGSFEFVVDDDDRVLAMAYLAQPVAQPGRLAEALVAETGLAGCEVASPRSGRAEAGLVASEMTTQQEPHCTIPIFPGVFTQSNRTMNRALVEHVVAQLVPLAQGTELLELYAGHGNFTYPLASRGVSVQAVEMGLRTELLPRAGNVRFAHADAGEYLRRMVRRGQRVHAVLLDPPRQGAKAVVPALAQLAPQHIVYVSCDPNTFARDGQKLVQAGYRLASLTPFDLMPQTYHTELVAHFVR